MSRLLRLSTPLQSNFKALFSSNNRQRALNDAIVLVAGRCHVSAWTLVPATQDVALDRTATGTDFPPPLRGIFFL